MSTQCSIGVSKNETCCDPLVLKNKDDYSSRERKILQLRTGCDKVLSVCALHHEKFWENFQRRQKKCSRPARSHGSNQSLRVITYEEYKRYKSLCPSETPLVPGALLCGFCKMKVNKDIQNEEERRETLRKECEEKGEEFKEQSESDTDAESELSASQQSENKELCKPPAESHSSEGSEFSTPPNVAKERVDASLKVFGQSPLDPKRLSKNPAYATKKVEKLSAAIQCTVQKASQSTESAPIVQEIKFYHEMINQLKGKFRNSQSSAEKFRILSLLPSSWSVTKIEEEFEASNYMARSVKKKVAEEGILCLPNPRQGRTLSRETEKLVRSMYVDDQYSRVMPGAGDYKIYKVNGKREEAQKRLILNNLRELWVKFTELYPTATVSFSKFAELRPPYCLLPGAKGTHTVCVCTVHQNFKLMLQAAHLHQGFGDMPPIKSAKDCFDLVLCKTAQEKCFFGECLECPGNSKLEENLQLFFDLQMIEEITYKQWISVDRSSLETIVKSTYDFIDSFLDQLEVLTEHDYIAKSQAKFLADRKKSLELNEVFVVGDFSMNYQPAIQDAVQGFHWNNNQVTVHPFVCYFRESEDSDSIGHVSYVVISDCLTHDTTSVYTFQKKLVLFLKEKLGQDKVKKIIYSSDGARSQYKNRKNVANLCFHLEDFGIAAEWHFSATAHGKGPSDGVAGLLKRLALRKSIQSPTEGHILNAEDLYNFVKDNMKSVTAVLVTTEEVEEVKEELTERFKLAKPLPGISKLHSIVPVSQKAVMVRRISTSEEVTRYQLYPEKPVNCSYLIGFATIIHEDNWCLAKINRVDEPNEVIVSVMKPYGSRAKYFLTSDSPIKVPLSKVLLLLTPTTDGNFFKLSMSDKRATAKEFLKEYPQHSSSSSRGKRGHDQSLSRSNKQSKRK